MISDGKFLGMVAQVDFGNVAVAITTLFAIAVALFTNRKSISHERELEEEKDRAARTERILDDVAEIFYRSHGGPVHREDCAHLAMKLQFRLNGTGPDAEDLRDALQEIMFGIGNHGRELAEAQTNLTKAARKWAAARGYNLSTEKKGT